MDLDGDGNISKEAKTLKIDSIVALTLTLTLTLIEGIRDRTEEATSARRSGHCQKKWREPIRTGFTEP